MQARYHNPETGTYDTKEEALTPQIIDPIVEKKTKTVETKTTPAVKPTKTEETKGGKE